MRFVMITVSRVFCCVFLVAALFACSDSSDRPDPASPEVPEPPEPEPELRAEIVWTEYGIPHITARDWAGLGYGYGYAYAQLNFCVVMKEYVRAAGESAFHLGAEGDLERDLIYQLFNSDERIQRLIEEEIPGYVVSLAEGYTRGLNRYLRETGVDGLPEGEEGCRGAGWVREVDVFDVIRRLHKAVLRASADPLADFTVAAAPSRQTARAPRPADYESLLAAIDRETFQARLDLPRAEEAGSNAYAVGADASQSSAGVLLGNPHFPWQGDLRWFMSKLTIPGEYEVMGATLAGLPLNTIGFNQNVAWTHTVSTGQRFTLYELVLNPDNPLEYLYDGEYREITTETVSAPVPNADGSRGEVEHTFYFSHYGPIVDLRSIDSLVGGWPSLNGTVFSYRDANIENLRGLEQWLKMGQASDLQAFTAELAALGIPWVNTIAADRYGDAFYGDISANPHVTRTQFDNCVRGFLQTVITNLGILTMDGSDSDCEWGSDEGAPPGLFGYDNLPKLFTREYAANANDSYWLANPRHLLEGFSPIIGAERVEQNLRPRAAFVQAEQRLAGSDGLGAPGFNVDNIRELLFGARNYTAELVLEDLVSLCLAVDDWSDYTEQSPELVAQACQVLSRWDSRFSVDSVGAHIFYEFWLSFAGVDDKWAVPFDVTDPVNTPRDLHVNNPEVVEAARAALADAVLRLDTAGIPMDRPWGEVQFSERNGERIGVHGGSGAFMFSAIYSPLVAGEGYSNIVTGNSYMQAVSWDESDCPDAYAVLSYSQSSNPESPHYADSARLYSQGEWIDMPYCEMDREAQEVRRETIEE